MNYVSWPDALPTPSANYGGTYRTPTVTTQFSSGRIRRRKVGRTSVKAVTLEWLFTPDEYDLWEVFYRDEINDGCSQFSLNMSTGGILQTGLHVVQCVGDYSFTHEECNFRVSLECVIFPYPSGNGLPLLEGYLGAPVQDFLDIMKIYYDRNYIQ